MKKRLVPSALLPCLLLLASLLPALAADPKVGDPVAAVWKDGKYYVGTVTAVGDGKVSVLYDDGDKLDVPAAKVHPFSETASFKEGDHVIAAWKGAKMYPGVITAVTDVSCTVKWDDGDTPQDVRKSRIIPFSE